LIGKNKISLSYNKYNNKNMNFNNISNNENISAYINIDEINNSYEVLNDENYYCKIYDPFKLILNRLKYDPKKFCESNTSNHICYINSDSNFYMKKGLICKMINIIIDPSKWKESKLNYDKGPILNKTKTFPLISKGFFNIDCKRKIEKPFIFNKEIYNFYINAWNYNYNSNSKHDELAPNKTIFFVSRNGNSHLMFSGAEIINALALIYYLNLKPENIQVVFLQSTFSDRDLNYFFYKNLISRGGEPIQIKNLKKKYHISTAFHIPFSWDTPLTYNIKTMPTCKYQSKAYFIFNQYVDKYIEIPKFNEPINYNNETFYYSKTVKNPNSKIYTKFLTFQWRKQ